MMHEPLRYAHEEGHTDVCYSSDGSKFITCGADGDIRIWSTEESEDPIHNCIGEWALSVRQKGNNLYVTTGSNDIQILIYPQGERNGVLNRFVAPINHIAISKNSEHIALAGEDMEVKLIDLESDEKKVTIFDGLTGPCLSTALNSKFLAASSGDGKLRIWNIERKELVKEIDCFPKTNSFANAKSMCRIDFEPVEGKFLAYPDKETVILLTTSDWSQYATLTCSEITAHFSIVEFSPCGNYLLATTLQGDFVVFNVNTKSVDGTSKHPNSAPVYTEGQLGIMSYSINKQSTISPEEGFTDNGVDFGDIQFEDDDDEDGENVISVEKLKKEVMGDVESELNFDIRSSAAPSPRPKTPEIPLQAPFMPSSTPEHLNPRYLCWNEVGVIRSYGSLTDEDSGKSIEIEFHDSSFHNSMMLQNYQDYIMGSVSKAALAVANANQIYVIPLSATSKEWMLKVEDSPEEIVLIAASDNLVCFGTNNYLVRVCSIFGTQRGVVSIPGPLVSMSSHQNSLLIAYHAGGIRKGDQCISIKLIKFNGLRLESQEINSALGPESTLVWLGFTDSGTPAMMNSLGMLSLYLQNSNAWVPFCDTSKHLKSPSDGFFVTAVIESYQTLMGIKCRGSVYPSFTPRPTVCELPLEPPFAEPSTEKTQLEVNLFAWSNLQIKDVNKKFTETGLKTFALACRNNLDQRALELMEIIANPQLLNLSTKYAVKLNKKLLAEKLMEMAAKIMNEEDEFSNSFLEMSAVTPPMRAPPRKLTLSSVKRTVNKPKQMPKEVSTPEVSQEESILSPALISASTEGSVTSEEPKNPFLKNLKKEESQPTNPLSLTNKFAGVDYMDAKENKAKNGESAEKRKQPESEGDKQREKQRKLDRFMFTKRT
ncbi:WD repeat and HMG-box DNA-binding protein 1 [Asbolus verrucosus]|uniref:WD repeat and HMG-box DNA-binding protein 1 n=1 Tax=Asbolus verrucosus TaxID=1661398 RepID=A0A482W7W2_ASBVE|nr:WD repeat and HMG-box DNA-binding protein 1 [Asbolus verrucosus]